MFRYITRGPLWVNIIIGFVFVGAIALVFILSLNVLTHHGVAKTVPSVTGKKLDSVQSFLKAQGFSVVIQDSVYYDSLPPSVIIKQVPEADAVVKVNRTVYVTVNRVTPPNIDMPNLVGYSFRNAEMVLHNLGLRLGDTTNRPDFAKNSVLQQMFNGNEIKPGDKIRMGSAISLVIGSGVGNENIAVPTLVGLTYNEAKILLEANGLIAGSVVPDPSVKDTSNSYVYRQSPQDKDVQGRRYRIRSGQMVDLWLSVNKPVVDTLTNLLPPNAVKQ